MQILINIFWPTKIKAKGFWDFYNDLTKLLQTFLVILLCWYKRYSFCLVSFFNLYELFPAFICTNNIGSLFNLCAIKFFNTAPSLFLFWGFNFTLSEIVSSGSSSPSVGGKLSSVKPRVSFKVCLEHLSFSSDLL